MSPRAAILRTVETLLRTNAHREAQQQLEQLISSIRDQLAPNEGRAILRTIEAFHPKRRRDLTELFTRRFGDSSAFALAPAPDDTITERETEAEAPLSPNSIGSESTPAPPAIKMTTGGTRAISHASRAAEPHTALLESYPRPSTASPTRRGDVFRSSLRRRLHQLSEQHIFQWTTFYRDYFNGELFPSLMGMARQSPEEIPELVEIIADELSQHAIDIFDKGYVFTIGAKVGGHQYAINKSVTGLQRFLELPLELYSSALRAVPSSISPVALRILCASMIRGILCGYGCARLGHETGKQVLPVRQRSWLHYVPFLTHRQLAATLDHVEAGQLVDTMKESILPVLGTLDRLGQESTGASVLPILGQYDWAARRLDVTLRSVAREADPRPVEMHCYLDSAYAGTSALEESEHRGIGVIVAPLKADVEEWARGRSSLAARLVAVTHFAPAEAEAQILAVVTSAFSRRQSSAAVSGVVTYNFARDFPLKAAQIPRYFHIYRRSVRDLLMTFERRNGVRVWCSVRRSGKTTACSDLGATGSDSSLITQTCQDTEGRPDSTLLYTEVKKALDSGTRLHDDFLFDVVESSGPGRRRGDGRFVLMIDEYEVLFGDLRTAVAESESLKYRIALPLLNQLLQFSRQNLVVLVGQEPDAHLILMDRNQLSAYVEQDGFPLFSDADDGEGSEFSALRRKVTSDRILIDRQVEALVYRETGGHPFLAANLLVEFMDWLIDSKVPALKYEVGVEHFSAFASDRLSARRLSESVEYSFFRGAAREALGTLARRRSPWLHSQYMILRLLASESPESLSMTRDELDELMQRKGAERSSRFSVNELLDTGSRANFLETDGDLVRPRIPLLARLSSLVVPGT